MYTEKRYDLSEEETQALIAAAQAGDGVAQLRLLEVFSNFLTKYITVLYYGKYDLESYDMRRFLALYVKDPGVRFFLLRNKLNPGGIKHLNEALRGIQYMVQRFGDIEDTTQTVNMSFLQCVQVYKPKPDITFSAFLYSYFFYVLKKQVDLFLIDQLGRKTFPLLADEEVGGDEYDDPRPVGFTAPPTAGADELIHAEEIDEHWVEGTTAHGPFANLTIQERQLLKWRYVNGERSSDIANRITEHSNTVREHFHKIRQKVREAVQRDLDEI